MLSSRSKQPPKKTPAKRGDPGGRILRVQRVISDRGLPMRCLVENTHESCPLEYAHILPTGTRGLILDMLEFSWGLNRYTLNVDTRYNTILLCPTLHLSFDSHDWILLPAEGIVNKYFDSIENGDGGSLPNISNNVFEYTLVPSKAMKFLPIHRQSPSVGAVGFPTASDYDYHCYPFKNFPSLRSHIHPKFVICNSGSKIANGKGAVKEYGDETHADLIDKMRNIWLFWTTPPTSRKNHEWRAFLNVKRRGSRDEDLYFQESGDIPSTVPSRKRTRSEMAGPSGDSQSGLRKRLFQVAI